MTGDKKMVSGKKFAVCSALCSMMSIQSGASIAKYLFNLLGPAGAVILRVGLASIMLTAVIRPSIRKYTRDQWLSIFIYGASIGLLNLTFYYGIQRIPVGIGVAVEFIGPLGLAVCSSRKALDFLWIFLAAAGIVLIVPWQGGGDWLGYLLVFIAGIMWAVYIVSAGKLTKKIKSTEAVSCGMCVAALVVLPAALVTGELFKIDFRLFLIGLCVAVLSSALPFSLDLFTLKNLPAKTYSVLQSLHPVFAALFALIFLKEHLTWIQWLAIVLIVTASAGTTLFADKNK